MKLLLTALLALSTISVSFADTPITEGHSYKVVNGNLVDTTASSEFAGPTTTPTPIPAQQPTIIINNNVTTQTQQVEVPPPAPANRAQDAWHEPRVKGSVWYDSRPATPDRPTVAESRFRIVSYWNHNGSTMGLLVNGNQRILIYVRVREGLEGLVEPGTVLFAGESESGRYKGKARRFSKGLPPIEYDVAGPILGGGNKVVLSGRAPIRNPDGSIKNVIEDRLEFSYLNLSD